jgi:RNA recognition motif-containing protein
MNIYVGNLPFSITEEKMREIFEAFGEIESIKLITDRETGRPRGFGFVEMDNSAADEAIKTLNNTEIDGRTIKVNQSEPKKPRSSGRRW